MEFKFTLQDPLVEEDFDKAAQSAEPLRDGINRRNMYLIASCFASQVEEFQRDEGVTFDEAWKFAMDGPMMEPMTESPMLFGGTIHSILQEFWGNPEYRQRLGK